MTKDRKAGSEEDKRWKMNVVGVMKGRYRIYEASDVLTRAILSGRTRTASRMLYWNRSCQATKAIIAPDDPRMKMVGSALWTYMMKVVGQIAMDKDAKTVGQILQRLSEKP